MKQRGYKVKENRNEGRRRKGVLTIEEERQYDKEKRFRRI